MNSLIQKRAFLILKILLLGCSLHLLFLSPVWAEEKCTPEIIKGNLKKFKDSDDLVKEIKSILNKEENNSNTVKNIKVSINKFKDWDGLEREQAFNWVVECNSVSVKVLRDELKEENTSVRFREMITFALAKIGKKAGEATPTLRETLKNDKSPIVRSNAAFALGEIGYKAKEAVPELIKALDEKNITVRDNAIYALGVIGDKAAIYPLIKNFRHNKIQDFFIMQKFLSYQEQFLRESNSKNFLRQWLHKNNIQANNILTKHIREPKFYGIYLMLATKLSEEAANNLHKLLIKDATDTKEHTLSDAFTKILISRGCLSTKA